MNNMHKAINIIMNENNIYDSTFYQIETIEYLEQIIEYYLKNAQLTQVIKNRIENYFKQAEKSEVKNKKEFTDKAFSLMNKINEQKFQDSISFYRLELLTRTNKAKYIFSSDKEIESKKNHINESVCNDCYVLYTHSDKVNDKDFFEIYMKDLINSKYYIESINSLLNSCPEIFKNSTFYSRTLYVLSYFDNKDMKKVQKSIQKYLKI